MTLSDESRLTIKPCGHCGKPHVKQHCTLASYTLHEAAGRVTEIHAECSCGWRSLDHAVIEEAWQMAQAHELFWDGLGADREFVGAIRRQPD